MKEEKKRRKERRKGRALATILEDIVLLGCVLHEERGYIYYIMDTLGEQVVDFFSSESCDAACQSTTKLFFVF